MHSEIQLFKYSFKSVQINIIYNHNCNKSILLVYRKCKEDNSRSPGNTVGWRVGKAVAWGLGASVISGAKVDPGMGVKVNPGLGAKVNSGTGVGFASHFGVMQHGSCRSRSITQ